MREFGQGVGYLLRGFAFWRRRPGAMSLGLVPAALVALAFTAALVALAAVLPSLTVAVTPFADGWAPVWATLLRAGVGIATFGAALALSAVTFTAVTLVVGEPFYDRVWRAVEQDADGAVPDGDSGFWRGVADAVSLVVRGIGVALLAWLVGLIPLVGGIAAAVLGVVLTGRLLSDELTSRAFAARGIDRAQRRALLRRTGPRALGFGVATQLCFLVPLGAVVTMPAAVAGSTLLARDALALSSASSPPGREPAARG